MVKWVIAALSFVAFWDFVYSSDRLRGFLRRCQGYLRGTWFLSTGCYNRWDHVDRRWLWLYGVPLFRESDISLSADRGKRFSFSYSFSLSFSFQVVGSIRPTTFRNSNGSKLELGIFESFNYVTLICFIHLFYLCCCVLQSLIPPAEQVLNRR